MFTWKPGQDAYFFKPNVFPKVGPAYSVIPCNSTWTNVKPYVIFGLAIVDSGCTLTINQGTKVYLHNNAILYVYKDGILTVNGIYGSPVTFQGDRLEPAYQTVPGQWGEIQLSPGSTGNSISWAVIKNGTIGVEADTIGSPTSPTLKIDHTIIKSMSNCGFLGFDSYVTGNNLLIEDCQNYCVNVIGGRYDFSQCTFADYWSYGQRQTSLLTANNSYTDVNGNTQSRALDSLNLYNSIVWGVDSEEVGLSAGGTGHFNYFFADCILKTKRAITTSHFNNCLIADPLFVNTSEPPGDNYEVNSSISPALKTGNTVYDNYLIDLNNSSINNPSTLGAYQN